MDSYGSYQNGASSSGATMTETEFQRLAQSVGTNIQKILQNGKTTRETDCFNF